MVESINRFNEEMNQGHNAAWDLDWQKAADHYRQALEMNPDDPNALVSLGLALFEFGAYDESIKFYSRAIEVAPNDPLALEKKSQLHELLGQNKEVISPALLASELYLKQGNLPKSIECLVRVIRVEPENLPAHSRLALIYERTGRKQRCVNEYLMVASLFQQKGDFISTQEAIDHALEIMPDSKEASEAEAIISAGQLLPKPVSVDLEKPRISLPEVSRTEASPVPEGSELDPIEEAHQSAISALANFVFEQDSGGQDGQSGDPGLARVRQAVILWSQDSRGAAADELEKALEFGLDHPAAYFELGSIRTKEDRLESAIRYLQRSVQAPDYALASRLLIARTYRYMNRLSEAATNYLEALRLADAQLVPGDQTADMSRMYTPIIEAEAKQTDPQIKNQLCDRIEKLLVRPGWQSYISQARGDFQIDLEGVPAIPVGELLSNPQGDRIVESVGQINRYARSGYWRSAMEEAFFAIQFAPTYLPLHTYMGELLLKQDHLEEAIEKFSAIAKTYHARGETEHAVKILHRIIKAAPMDLDARNQLISLQEEMGFYDEAVEEKVNLAGVYYNLADLSHAREVYLDAFRIAQNHKANPDLKINILYRLADIELQSLDWKQAEEIYAQIQSLNPDDFQATEKLIELKLRLGQDDQAINEIDDYVAYLNLSGEKESGLDYLNKLVQEYPERVDLHRKRADLLQESGQTELAIQEYDVIGELLLDAGDRQGAIEVIEKILALDPPDKAQYEELIKSLAAEG